MKLLDETRHRGRRVFLMMAENETDRHVVNEFARVLRDHPVLDAEIVQGLRDKFASLRIEEPGT